VQEAVMGAKLTAVGAMGRLVAAGSAMGPTWLGPALLSHYVAHGKEVADAVKEICRWGNL
jgi:hypothetical protein